MIYTSTRNYCIDLLCTVEGIELPHPSEMTMAEQSAEMESIGARVKKRMDETRERDYVGWLSAPCASQWYTDCESSRMHDLKNIKAVDFVDPRYGARQRNLERRAKRSAEAKARRAALAA